MENDFIRARAAETPGLQGMVNDTPGASGTTVPFSGKSLKARSKQGENTETQWAQLPVLQSEDLVRNIQSNFCPPVQMLRHTLYLHSHTRCDTEHDQRELPKKGDQMKWLLDFVGLTAKGGIDRNRRAVGEV